MEIRGKIPARALPGLINVLFFSAMFALPWIDQIRVSTYLFTVMGGILVIAQKAITDYKWYSKQLLFTLFLTYYIFQVVVFCVYPEETTIHAGVEKKLPLVFIPLLLLFATQFKGAWQVGVKGFILGNTTAALCCFAIATLRFFQTKDVTVFFYHKYSSPIGLSAIYFSMDILVALGYLLLGFRKNYTTTHPQLLVAIGFFLFINLLLLSSKTMIVVGALLLTFFIYKTIKNVKQRAVVLSVAIGVGLFLVFVFTPLKERYLAIDIHDFSTVTNRDNFHDFAFDGLNLRVLLWHMGLGLISENKMWLWGAGGERYHSLLNEKIRKHGLYTGNGTVSDRGYLDYNMHNQYMESYVQFGLAGVVLLLWVLGYLFYYSFARQHEMLIYVTALFAAAFVTESFWERQSGLLLFTIIISGEWIQLHKKKQPVLNLI